MAGSKQGMDITFRSLSYTVDIVKGERKGETISILNNLHGYFIKNQMCALMGPSGAGKTTLLDILSGRKNQGNISGTIEFEGLPPSPKVLKRYTGYVEQFDTLIGTLTVEEMLTYTAELKCSEQESLESKKSRVAALIEELGLVGCKDTVIGEQLMRGISGGQAKRVNIGLALITEPRIIFMDEPTSGLDSAIAHDVMCVVKELAKHGRTVCATIHSPTSETFRLFDRLYLLSKGHCVFFGEPHKEAIPYMSALGFEFTMGDSVSDWLLHITGGGVRDKTDFDFAGSYLSSALMKENEEALERLGTGSVAFKAEELENLKTDSRADKSTAVSMFKALKVLFKYRSLRNFKNGQYIGQRLGDKILLSLVIMSVYWNNGGDLSSQTHVLNISASLFMFVTLPAYGAAAYTPSLVLDRPLFYRERHDGCYTTLTYMLFRVLEEATAASVSAAVFCLIPWWALNLSGSLGLFFVVFWMSLNIGIVLAYFFAGICPNLETANAALPAYVTVNLFFSGLLVNYRSFPIGWEIYSYISHMRYAWTAIMVNQFEDTDALVNGRHVMDFYALEDKGTPWENVGYLCLFYLAFFFLAYLGMQYINHSTR